jgi:N-acetylglutamate synthase-like GNAT family acetyltransferase
MQCDHVTDDDLEMIGDLQPDGWPDIKEAFKCYIAYEFCNPIKVIIDNTIVGVGTSIMFENTGWLAHIIVHRDFRNKGIGSDIVECLLNDLSNKSVSTVLLIATDLGEPIYKKAGFRLISDYIYLKRKDRWKEKSVSKKIVPYRKEYYSELIKLDKRISGENRESLIKKHIDHSIIYLDNNKLTGFYIPNLGEGLIFANNSVAGIELMKIKYSKVDRAVIPSENKEGIDFLTKNGFILSELKGKRMILGKDIPWKPECIFSRTGGNYG